MKNFIFKSSQDFGLIKNVFNKLETIQSEQRHARSDLTCIIRMLSKLTTDKDLQQQVDKYFDDDISETSPQTDTDEQ